MFVALSHCDKQKFSLLYWITATNKQKMFVALSQWDKQSLYMLPKSCQKCQQCSTFWHLWPIFDTFKDFYALFCIFCGHLLLFFGFFFVIYTNFVCRGDSVQQTKILFVVVAQSHKPNFCLSQWLSATNNGENFFQFLCWM